MNFSILLSLFAIVILFAVIPNANAAVDMFLKIEGVKGESTDKTHKDEIEVLAWSWGMSNPGTTHVGGGDAEKVSVQDISVTKYVDRSSPILLLRVANGEHFEKATLVVRKAGADPVEFKTIILENLIVTSISLGGSDGEDRLTENVSFNFQKVRTEYRSFDGKDSGTVSFDWDVASSTAGDTTPPTFLTSDITVEADSFDGKIVEFTIVVFDDTDPNPQIECNPPSGSTFPLGATTVNCTASDASGNESTGSFLVTIVDTTPPSITAPSDLQVVSNTAGGWTGDIGSASASDIADPEPEITNDAPATFPIGETIVTWTATDDSGNSSTATQKVTVLTKSQATQVLVEDIKNFGLPKGIEKALTSKLDAAVKSFDKNNEKSACGQLGAFVNGANAQSGKKLSQAQVTQMFDMLKQILEVMNNCPKPLQSIG